MISPTCFLILAKMSKRLPMETIEYGGLKWEYSLSVPSTKPKGLIIGMHGAGGDGAQFAENTGLIKAGLARGYAVLIPTGQPASLGKKPNFKSNPNFWNSGHLPPDSARAKVDDVGYFETLLKVTEKRVGEVPLFITGHSNGSGMTYNLARVWKGKVSAIASVSGQLPLKLEGKSEVPIPTLFICGSDDPVSPWAGGESELPWGKKQSRPVLDMMKAWASWQGIDSSLSEVSKSGDRTVFSAKGYQPRAIVQIIRIEKHGHAWPGGTKGFADRMMGPNETKFDATGAVLDWFDLYLANR